MQIAFTPIPLDAPRRPLIYSVKVSDLVIVACFYYHTEVCVWDTATYNLVFFLKEAKLFFQTSHFFRLYAHQLMVLDGDLFEADSAPPNPWHFICLDQNSLLTMHGVIFFFPHLSLIQSVQIFKSSIFPLGREWD